MPKAPTRNVWLDAIRAVAILLVVLHHAAYLRGTPLALWVVGSRGYVGVDLFFVLSGWLIGGQLFRNIEREGRVPLWRFWVRRWIRTLPAYYAMLAVLAASGQLPGASYPTLALFLQNYLAPSQWPVTWSLCIEEHFYLVLPLVAAAVYRCRTLGYAAMVAIVLASPALRALVYTRYAHGPYWDFFAEVYCRTHFRLDGLAVGVLAAMIRTRGGETWRFLEAHARPLAAGGAALLAAFTYNPLLGPWGNVALQRFPLFVPGFLGISLGVGLLLPAAVAIPVNPRRPAARIVTWIAEHAYALYLTHLIAFHCVEVLDGLARARGVDAPFSLRLAVAVLACVAFAAALRFTVELPAIRWRDRIEAASTRPSVIQPG